VNQQELAERSRAAAAENNEVVLAVLADAGDAGLRPGELAEQADLPERTARETVARLEGFGLVQRDGKRRLWATAAGRSEAGAGTPGLALAPTLDVALARFPAEAQRAFARLLLSAIPARWHLADEHADGWPGFIALGPSKTGKTALATLVCRLYGLDELQAIKLAQDETPGSLMARRERSSESETGYRVDVSPLLALPFACIDEWDKAPDQVRMAASRLLLGHTATELEGERLALRPTVLVCLNSSELRVLHEAHVRRSVVLDTSPITGLLGDLDEHMRKLFQETPLPRLLLERLQPPTSALPPELRHVLREELRAGLTDEGWALSDVEPLARLALGRATLTEAQELDDAVLATVFDYLTCAATVGHARDGFAGRLGPQLGAHGALLPNADAAELEASRQRRNAQAGAERAAAGRLQFEHTREARASIVIGARDELGRARDAERNAIAKALTRAAKEIRGTRSQSALDAEWQAVQPYLVQARAWNAAQVAAVAGRERIQREGRDMAKLQRQHASAERTAAAAERKQALEEWRVWRSALGGLMPYSSDAELQEALGELQILTRRTAKSEDYGGGRIGTFSAALIGTHWVDAQSEAVVTEAQAVAVWQARYDDADAHVVACGGRTRPRTDSKRNSAARTTRAS
jgi:hypothetical protein